MNVWDLAQAADAAGYGSRIVVSQVPPTGTGLASDATVVEPVGAGKPGSWTTYHTEKGQKFDQEYFNSEDEACREVIRKLEGWIEQRDKAVPMSDADLEEGRRISALHVKGLRDEWERRGL